MEKWHQDCWLIWFGIMVVFCPIGLAMIIRKIQGEDVFYDSEGKERRMI